MLDGGLHRSHPAAVGQGTPPKHKALMLATMLLLDYMYYERDKNDDNNRR